MEMTLLNNFKTFARTVLFSGTDSSMGYSSCTNTPSGSTMTHRYCIGNLYDWDGNYHTSLQYFGFTDSPSYSYAVGNNVASGQLSLFTFNGNNTNSAPQRYIFFTLGSGTTPVDLTDYQLDNRITSGYSISVSGLHFEDVQSGFGRCIYTLLIRNTSTTDDLVINEVGLNKSMSEESSWVTANRQTEKFLLLARAVLDETITLVPGATTSLQLVITL